MRNPGPRQSDARNIFDLQPTPALYKASVAFCLVGLSTQFPWDLLRGGAFYALNDVFSYLVFLVVLVLYALRKIGPGIGLVANLLETLRNLFGAMVHTGLVKPYDPTAGDWIQETLLLTCVFASVIGLSLNKTAALAFAGFAVIAQFSYLAVFTWDEFGKAQFMITSITMVGGLLVIYYYRATLERLVLQLRAAHDETRRLMENAEAQEVLNRPYVAFGRNTAGLVHDFRNDINSMSLALQTLMLTRRGGLPLDFRDMDQIGRSIANLRYRIAMVEFVTSASRAGASETLDLRQVLESALYPFRISPEIRNRIDFRCDFIGGLSVTGNRLRYLELFENIIRNSCEALIDRDEGRGGAVEVVLARYGDWLEMEFRDDGDGIPACFGCSRFNCLDCEHFAIGRSSKKYGNGFGMINVFRAVRAMDGRLRIKSAPTGTSIAISLPVPAADV